MKFYLLNTDHKDVFYGIINNDKATPNIIKYNDEYYIYSGIVHDENDDDVAEYILTEVYEL